MQPTQIHFPVFEANQVLMSGHLNDLFNFLDEQNRLTRSNLVGVGIVCGLTAAFDTATHAVRIGRGCGISTQGYFIEEAADSSYPAYRVYQPPNEIAYATFANKNLWELVSAGDPRPATALDVNFISDKAAVLFLELKNDALRNCSATSCDDKGSEVTVTVRPLLMKLTDIADLTPPELPAVPLPRIAFATPQDLQNQEKKYRDFFVSQIDGKTVVNRLADAIGQAYQVLKPLMPDLTNADVSQLAAKFALPATSVAAIQYYYGFLRDLTAAYHELRAALLQQTAICLADGAAFPRHLVLGALNAAATKQVRTGFVPTPAVAETRASLPQLRFLFERLNRMVKGFLIPSGAQLPIRVTPSRFGAGPLSSKAMPFYFKAELRQQWDTARQGKAAHEVLSWHGYDDVSSPGYVRNPLQFDLEPYNFFRVEGHIGKNLVALATGLDGLIKNSRLPFSILHLSSDAIGDFLAEHYAIEPEAGAPRGGTLVVLHGGSGANANLILADFALPYRVELASSSCASRVAVRESAYAWFDTKQHLTKIARHAYLQSKEADKAVLSQYYVINIYRYQIQNASLVSPNQPQQVRIPIGEMIDGQLAAIARHLNEQFPGGLVFDYDAVHNKLLIRYFADQTFRIEWGGLQGNQFRYAFTPDGVARRLYKAWQPLYAVVSHARDEYCADQYRWLHGTSCYGAIYPAPAAMASHEDLLAWEQMIKVRALVKPLPIANLLSTVRHVIDETYNVGNPQVEAVLIGSWADGSWVSRNAQENKFPPKFVELRTKVTGRTGPSDIALLIHSTQVGLDNILTTLMQNPQIKNSGYVIQLIPGKRNAQRGVTI